MATTGDVEKVFRATEECKTREEIVKSTGLTKEVVDECITHLRALGVVSEDSDRVCNYNAVRNLKKQFDKICVLCGENE